MPPELPSELSAESGMRPQDLQSDIISDNEIKPLEQQPGFTDENGEKIQETEGETETEEEIIKLPEEPELTPEEEEAIRKQITIEMRKAELRQRMEEASKARRAKKGFMTPERKKKLRLLLRRKAAEELKKEQERKAAERQWIIEDRCGDPEDLEWASKDDLIDICEDYFQRIYECESEKWDLEFEMRKKAFEIAELSSKVNDLRGKFQRPILKKVSKYENKFSLLQRKAAEFNYRNQLKMVKRPDFTLKDMDDKKSHTDKRTEKGEEAGDTPRSEQGTPVQEDIPEESVDSAEEEGLAGSLTTDGDGEKLPEGDEAVSSDGAVSAGESQAEGEEAPRLEVENAQKPEGEATPLPEGESGVEGGQLGGQSPEEGEVQPTESLPTPPPEHTEEDLWLYLKETVTSVHPSTVEEFVQNLIGTLQHVPEEYLKPVIEANIKRTTSPFVTDEEHLLNQEGEPLTDGQEALLDGSVPAEGANSSEGGTAAGDVVQETSDVGEETAATMRPEIPEELQLPEETAEGFSSVEAAA